MNLDWNILYWMQEHLRCSFLDFTMPKVTLLGEIAIVWIIIGIVLICIKKYRKQGIILLAGLAIGALIGNVILKNLIARPRPCTLDATVKLLIATPSEYSFPSGHALSSTIAAVILTKINHKFGYWAIPLAAILMFSRLYLFVHFPSDILAGILIGLIIGFVTYYFGNKIIQKSKPENQIKSN